MSHGRFSLSQTAGAKLESAINRSIEGERRGRVVEWMARGNNMSLVAKLESGEYELRPVNMTATTILSAALGIVSVLATTEQFVTAKAFTVNNTGMEAEVEISYVEDNFFTWFLGKTEEPFVGSRLRYQKLEKRSRDDPIITELGGEEMSETTLTEMFSLMKKQGHGQEGVLLTNGWANIFYIRDAANILRAVYVICRRGSWRVRAYPFDFPDGWGGGAQVFSRTSVTV